MKQPKEYLKRKKQSEWHWDFWNTTRDPEMCGIIANIQGKWPRVPKILKENVFLYSNPVAIAQQKHYGVSATQNYVGMNLNKETNKRYEKFIMATELVNPVAYIHIQQPGQMTVLHMDNARADNRHHDENGKILTEKQRRERIGRVFIMLDDWHPGQVIMMGSEHFTHWKKGDMIYFSWKDLPHGTANFGHHSRPMLFVQGDITEAFRRLIKSGKKKIIKVR
jgi:hypothetical protein